MRNYAIRAHHPERAEIDIDFVLHATATITVTRTPPRLGVGDETGAAGDRRALIGGRTGSYGGDLQDLTVGLQPTGGQQTPQRGAQEHQTLGIHAGETVGHDQRLGQHVGDAATDAAQARAADDELLGRCELDQAGVRVPPAARGGTQPLERGGVRLAGGPGSDRLAGAGLQQRGDSAVGGQQHPIEPRWSWPWMASRGTTRIGSTPSWS
jgi:hypothetical protein